MPTRVRVRQNNNLVAFSDNTLLQHREHKPKGQEGSGLYGCLEQADPELEAYTPPRSSTHLPDARAINSPPALLVGKRNLVSTCWWVAGFTNESRRHHERVSTKQRVCRLTSARH